MAFNLTGAEETLTIREGADISLDISLADDNGSLDLTGYTATMRIGPDLDNPAELTLTVGSGLAINATEGIITITLTNAQTDALTFSTGRYDLEIVDGGGLIDPVLYGKFVVGQKVPNGS